VHSLEERFDRTVREELCRPGTRPQRFGMRLPPALRETLIELGQPAAATAFYCERMPRMLIDQVLRGDDPARALLHRPLDLRNLPRLRTALEALRAIAGDVSWLRGETIAELASKSLLGTGLPLVGAGPAELELINEELRSSAPDEVLDLRLSGGLTHELCHGPEREATAQPWMVREACALWLGAQLFPRHVFPDVAGEAVPGVSLFVLFGQVLARRFGRAAAIRGALGEEVFSPALRELALEDWRARQEVPFARDALRVMDWVRAVQGSWAGDAPQPEDFEIARTAVRALFQTNVLAPTYQTHPLSEIHDVRIDFAAHRIARRSVAQGAFGEPAFWIWPPPLCRRPGVLHVARIRREEMEQATQRLIEECS
jgi:hypothetical protein